MKVTVQLVTHLMIFDDSDEEQTFDKEQADEILQPGTKIVVFWSCIVTLLKICRVCFQTVKICKIFQKSIKVIVDVVCESNHKYSWHSQPNENSREPGTFELLPQLFYLEGLLKD